jgi:hypothetical protein
VREYRIEVSNWVVVGFREILLTGSLKYDAGDGDEGSYLHREMTERALGHSFCSIFGYIDDGKSFVSPE